MIALKKLYIEFEEIWVNQQGIESEHNMVVCVVNEFEVVSFGAFE